MPIPVINPTVSIQAWVKGEFSAYQAAATNIPTAWAAANLPAGVVIDNAGLIQGVPTTNGAFEVILTATNGSGTSEPLHVAMGVERSPLEGGAGINIFVELETGFVRGVFAETAAFAMYAKHGDKIPVFIAFTLAGVPQSLALAMLKFGVKEFEPEELVQEQINDGASFEQLGTYESTRYRTLIDFDNATIKSWLDNYEDDKATYFPLLGEIEATILEEPVGGGDLIECRRSSQTFRIFMERDLIPQA